MPRSVSTFFEWAMMAAAFGLLLFILVSPSGSFVRTPMEHTRQAREDGGLLAVQASAVAREDWLAPSAD